MYQRKVLLDYCPMIMIVSGYTLARNSSMGKPNRSDWVPTSFLDNQRRSSPKESVPDLCSLVVIWDVMDVLWFYTHNVFTGVSSDEPEYKSSLVMMSAHTCNGQKCFPVLHWVTVAFFNSFFCVTNVRDNLSSRCRRPLLCGSSHRFL